MISGRDIYSYSKINLFNNCPKRYKFYYLDKIKKKDEGVEAFLGKIVHQTLEWVYDLKIKFNKSYYSLDNILDKYKDLWYDNLHNDIRSLKYSMLKKNDYYTMGMRLLIEYYNNFGPNFDEPVIKVEKKLWFQVGNYSFISIIDRIDKIDSDLAIIDYKTGKKELSEKSLKNDLQMGVYHLAMKSNFTNSGKISLSHYYLRTGNRVTTSFSSEDEIEFENNIIKNIERINSAMAENTFESKESNLCNWCYYWKECDKKTGLNPSKYIK